MTSPEARLTAALADRYRIERELGAGGMATVYLAEDLKHGRKVAIKVLRPELAAVIGAERFLSEIKTTANLQHPHILPLFDSGIASLRMTVAALRTTPGDASIAGPESERSRGRWSRIHTRNACTNSSAASSGVGGWKMRGWVTMRRNLARAWSDTAYASSEPTSAPSHARWSA